MAEAIVYPKNPREYLHDNGANLVDRGYKWIFGLPQDGTLSSNTCGALPFRMQAGLSGVNEPKVLRGEDWEFLVNWVDDRMWLPDRFFWADVSYYPPVTPNCTKSPDYNNLSDMYVALSSIVKAYGRDFQLVDQEVSSEQHAHDVLRNCLVPCLPISPLVDPDSGILQLSDMQNFFADTAKLSCTIAECLPLMNDGSGAYYAQMYSFYQRDGEAATIQSDFLSSLNLNLNFLYENSTNPDRVILFDVQFIALLACFTADSEHGSNSRYALVNLLSRQPIMQNFNRTYKFSRYTTWGGTTAANLVAQVLGENPRPTPPPGGYASFACELRHAWAVVWPYYLQLN